ncbi:MAG: 2-dehydro-3-deoxygalactonokinase [Proteobacteria bacterium]|nr:2-dehydro-3-deoxygalactonokinase [Pseudomonadota bacterium]
MPGGASLLACDWGTTNLRAWTLADDGAVLHHQEFPLGVGRLQPGEAAARFGGEVRPAMGADGLPAILCGMIGSNLGWTVVPYDRCPTSLEDLAGALHAVAPEVRIVPGVSCPGVTGASDVMRGEETQILGWVSMDPARAAGRHLICHPGTHAKWALVEDGRLVRFATAMTGELFAVLRKHSVLRTDDEPGDEAAFAEGEEAAGEGDALSSRLFSARGRIVADGKPAGTAADYLSGLLIGAEVAGTPALLGVDAGAPVQLIGDLALCRWYRQALSLRGVSSEVCDGEEAALAGLAALHGRTA